MIRAGLRTALAVALITGAAVTAAPVSAEVRLAVSPSFLRLAAPAGGGGAVDVTVVNTGDELLEVGAAVADYRVEVSDRSARPWTSVEPSRQVMEPGAQVTFRVRIAVPRQIPSGGRYAAITLTTSRRDAGGNSTEILGSIEVPIWLAIRGEGPLTRIPVLERFAPVLEPDGRLGARAVVRNDGNSHLFIAAALALGEPGQDPVARLTLPERGILPGARRTIVAETTLPFWGPDEIAVAARFRSSSAGDRDDFAPFAAELDFSPLPEVALGTVGVCERLDGGPRLTADLVNTGGIGVVPQVAFHVRDAEGSAVADGIPAEPPVIWPTDTTSVGVDLPAPLPTGAYTVSVDASWPGMNPLRAELPFTIGGDPATAAPLCPPEG